MIPVVYHTMSNGIVNAIARRLLVGDGFVAYEEVKVFNAALGS